MIYLDYSATTPVNEEVLNTFNEVTNKFIGNPNSLHELGIEANNLIKQATKQIASLLNIKEQEIIYTSGSSESNNLAIKGIALRYKDRGNHIITTRLEHSSIYGPINYLVDNGFEVDFVDLDENGLVNLEHLRSLIKDTTILVTIAAVNSEVGTLQNIDEIGILLKKYPKCYFHCDMTQSIGKVSISLDNVDLASFSAHKIYGIKGIGCLIKKDGIIIEPLIHGGKSTTSYRSGTPAVSLIASLSKALRLSMIDLDKKYQHIEKLNSYIKENLNKDILINSNSYSIPHVLNFSVLDIKPETFQHAIEKNNIYISTQSACSNSNAPSKAVLAITNNENRASHSLRISLSHLTTLGEVKEAVKTINECYCNLNMEKR